MKHIAIIFIMLFSVTSFAGNEDIQIGQCFTDRDCHNLSKCVIIQLEDIREEVQSDGQVLKYVVKKYLSGREGQSEDLYEDFLKQPYKPFSCTR